LKSEGLPINEDIRASRLVLIDQEGNHRGEFLRLDALKLAEEVGLDLVMVSDGQKPTCKLMDYGKFIYAQKKKSKNNAAPTIKNKEIKFNFQTDDDYVEIKTRQARGFLEDGNRVKFSIKYLGRQAHHLGLIYERCDKIFADLQDVAEMEAPPKNLGDHVSMILCAKR
jgi:translation initiation factor IF-3